MVSFELKSKFHMFVFLLEKAPTTRKFQSKRLPSEVYIIE